MPSPLLPACCQWNVHFWPALMTPGMSFTVDARAPAGGARVRRRLRRDCRRRRVRVHAPGGGVLHVAVRMP